MLDDQLKWGHAVWCADLDGDGDDELVIGVRDPLPGKAQSAASASTRPGRRGEKWEKRSSTRAASRWRTWRSRDLNGDGKPDIVAVGRQTKNVRIYWNGAK